MGHDEDTNNFNGGTTPVTPNPRAQLGNNRLGMQKSRDFSAADELNRIVEAEKQENPVTSGGDIVLAPTEKAPKDKKVFIIIALTIITVAVFAVGIFMNMNKNGGIFGGGGNGGVSSAAKSKFTEFAEFYLGDTTAFSGSYDPTKAYKVDEAIKEKDATFFDTANQKLEAFTSTIGENVNEEIKTAVESYKKAYKFADAYGRATLPTESDIVKKYQSDGKDAAIKYIESAYSGISNIGYNDSNKDVAAEIEYYTSMITFYDLYSANGCIPNNGVPNDSCLAKKIGEKEATSAAEIVVKANKNRAGIEKYVNYSKSALWSVNEKINGESE